MLVARAALAEHLATVEIVHALGATDRQLAALLRWRIGRDAAIGSATGLAAAAATIRIIGERLAALDAGLIAGVTIGPLGWCALVGLPIALVLLTMLATQATALLMLRGAA